MENMNNNQDNKQEPSVLSAHHGKPPYWVLAVAAVVVVGLWWWIRQSPESNQSALPTASPTPSNTPVANGIREEVDNIDLGNLEEDFKSIDQDLNTL